MYGNLLTGLCRSEEMLRQIGFATDLGRRCGVTVDSMMISDVPGLTWGLVPALAQHGVKYISDGPNASRSMDGDRIGYVRVQWENKPFYWESPSGEEKRALLGRAGRLFVRPPFFLAHGGAAVSAAAARGGAISLRHRATALDQGRQRPADEGVMPAVRDWNAKYAYPKLIIATTSEAFHAFEKRYGDKLPTFRGDMTPYWEDGAASSARETAPQPPLRRPPGRRPRRSGRCAIPESFPSAEFAVAWKNVALYSEHTWGAHNSISQPDLPFVKNQWKYKQGYALDADKQSRELLDKALAWTRAASGTSSVDVFNTASWPRTDLVTLPERDARARL